MKISLSSILPGILSALLGLALGWQVSRMTGRERVGTPDIPEPSAITRSARPTRAIQPRPNERHNLQALLNLDWERVNRDATEREFLAASNEELEKLLGGLIELDKPGRPLAVVNLRNRVVREIYRREGRASLARAEQLGNPGVLKEFIVCLAREDAIAASSWLEPFRTVVRNAVAAGYYNEPGKSEPSDPAQIAVLTSSYLRFEGGSLQAEITSAAFRQGEEAVRKLLELPGWESRLFMANSLHEGFDYQKYLEAQNPGDILNSFDSADFLEFWAMHNPDAAFAFVQEISLAAPSLPNNRLSSAVFQAVCKMDGEMAAAEWLSGVLGQCPEPERKKILSKLFIYRHRTPSPAACREIMAGLQEESDRIIFGASLVNPPTSLEDSPSYLRRSLAP